MPRAAAPKPDIAEDRSFQQRFWKIERLAWVFFALLLLGALAGAFGRGGPLASGSAPLGAGRVDYPAIARWQAGEEFAIRVAGDSGERRLVLSSEFLQAFKVDSLRPEPGRVEATAAGHAYFYPATSDATLDIWIAVTPRSPGYFDYAITSGDGAAHLSTLVWP